MPRKPVNNVDKPTPFVPFARISRAKLRLPQRASSYVHLYPPMHDAAKHVGLREGAIYIDLDGTPVRLVRIIGDVCCWVVSGKGWNERQHTLNIHFAKRFRYDSEATASARRQAARHRTSNRNKVSTGLGTYILPAHEAPARQQTHYRVGERVPQPGIYRAMHESDDVASAVILLAGSVFPYCARCGIDVDFEFLVDVPTKLKFGEFHLQTLEIPHPELGASAPEEFLPKAG